MKKYSAFETQLGESALDLTDKAKLSLYKKSQNSGISVDILEEVYRRGYRCWTEAFGGTAEQFAFDRVNSFIAEGFAAQLDEDLKKACWKGYEAVGMKKKNGKTVPNCVPVKEQLNAPLPPVETIANKFDKPVSTIKRVIKSGAKVEKEHTKDQKTAEKIATAHVNERPDYYKKLNKAGLEEQEEARSKDPNEPCSRFVGSDELVTIYKSQTPGQVIKKVVREAALDAAHGAAPQASGLKPTTKLGRNAPTEISSRGSSQGLNRAGNVFSNRSAARGSDIRQMRMTSGTTQATAKTLTPQRVSANQPAPKTASAPTSAPKPSASFGSSSRPTTVSATSGGMEKSGGYKLSSGMSDAGKAKVKPTAPVEIPAAAGKAAGVLGKLARVATGPAVTAAATVMEPTPAGEKKSEFERQADVAKGISYKPQGRSVSDYEKQTLTPKTYEKPTNPKVDAPTPPSRPEYFSRGQAFQAAHKQAGDVGKFTYDNKEFQSNVEGKPYLPASKLKSTGIEAESGTKKKIKEAIAEGWQDSKYKNPTGGLTQAGVNAYRRENPGSKLQTAVTTKPSKLDPDSKPAKRRKSFCARMGGMKKRLTSAKTANDPDSRINKALRKWNCEETNYEGNE